MPGKMSVLIVHGSISVMIRPNGSEPCAVAVLVTDGTSDSVTVWLIVPVVDSPGDNVLVPSVTAP